MHKQNRIPQDVSITLFTVVTSVSASLNELVLCLPLSGEHVHDVSEAGQQEGSL